MAEAEALRRIIDYSKSCAESLQSLVMLQMHR